jgi:hypothetical protein
MTTLQRVLLFFVLPIVAVLLYPPATLLSGIGALVVVAVFFIALGMWILRGYSLALTFSIFLQGLNVIVRIMMFWSNGFTRNGVPDILFIATSLAGIILSFWLLVRLDRQDVRTKMIR